MRIATWNVNGIRARAGELCDWLARDRPDVVCLQELKAEPTQIPDQCAPIDYHVYWHGRKGYSGVSLHVARHLAPTSARFSHPPFDVESRIVQAELGNLVIASVYVPNGGKDYPAKLDFINKLIGWTREIHAEGRELVLCGDINIARTEMDVHPKEQKANAVGQLPEERALFETLLGDELVDVGRRFDPDNPGLFTWWAPWRNLRARNIGWRLDYFLVSKSVTDRATSCFVQAEVGTSDHAPVMLTLEG